MIKIVKIILVLTTFISISCNNNNSIDIKDRTKLVDLMIGTDWNEHTFPDTTLPNGLVQLSPDTKTADLDKYPVKNSGIITTINIDSIKDDRPFGYIFEGFTKAPVDGMYIFHLQSNDGFTLFLNDELIIDNDYMLQTLYAEKAFKKGYHAIKVNYFQMGGGKKLEVKWKNFVSELEEIPAAVLFHKM